MSHSHSHSTAIVFIRSVPGGPKTDAVMERGKKQCWICYEIESSEAEASSSFISPCVCRGTMEWVHQVQ